MGCISKIQDGNNVVKLQFIKRYQNEKIYIYILFFNNDIKFSIM